MKLPGTARLLPSDRLPPRRALGVQKPELDPLLRIDRYLEPTRHTTLGEDVRAGLTRAQKSLPPKYFYDDRGSKLFDAICDLPEYYLTRTERALLEAHAGEIIDLARPTDVIELGSGASRKTRVLLDALMQRGHEGCYIPMDVSESMLRRSAVALRSAYPGLRVHGIVGDYERHLERIPAGERRLVLFLGSTIGNFSREDAGSFLRAVTRELAAGDWVLVGMDLVKPVDVLHAAYNDAAGVTAEFNRNVLRVLNRELGADFEPERFEHLAFFNPDAAQIEMHLRAGGAQRVRIPALGLQVSFASGETIHTEISRKFTRADAEEMFAGADCSLVRWYTPDDEAFALALGVMDRRPR